MAKYRFGFVTNSSSSSFIISKDKVSRGELLEILLEIANEEAGEQCYDWDDVTGTCVAGRYNIKEYTKENPYVWYDDWYGINERKDDNCYVVDNDDCGRYNWNAVETVLKRHNIEWEYGNCD